MRKVPFGELKIGTRFFDINDGLEYVKMTWTTASQIYYGKVKEFRGSGCVYVKGTINIINRP